MDDLTCDDCGVSYLDDNSVEETICPYADEIYGDVVDCILCASCYHQRSMDI